MFTADGLRFHEPVTIDGQTLQILSGRTEAYQLCLYRQKGYGGQTGGCLPLGYQSYDYYRALIRWILPPER